MSRREGPSASGPAPSGTDLLLRSIFASFPGFAAQITGDGGVLFASRLPDFDEGTASGAETIFDFVAPAYHDTVRECLQRVLGSGKAASYETIEEGPSGEALHFLTRISPIVGSSRTVVLGVLCTEITDAKRVVPAQEESEALLQEARDSVECGVWSWECDEDRVTVDETAKRYHGHDGSSATLAAHVDRVHPEDRPRVKDGLLSAVMTGEFSDVEYRVAVAQGESRWLLVRGATVRNEHKRVVRVHGVVFDVTERARSEERRRQLEKMEAVAQLSEGVAHNFNNLLTAIGPNIDLAVERTAEPIREALLDARAAASQATELVRQLMLFARTDDVDSLRRVRDIWEIIHSVLEIAKRSFDHHVRFEIEGGRDPAEVSVDGPRFERALLNVLFNCRDALRERSDPRIRVSVDVVSPLGMRDAAVANGKTVRIRIFDNGAGMTKQVQERCFEPFYTTKEVGRGTGLGLATTYAIVKDHDGWVECESQLRCGTTFSLFLPLAAARSISVRPLPRKGKPQILVIDDEDLVRTTIERLLRQAGYTVVLADRAEAAFKAFQSHSEHIDLAIVDWSMGDLSGGLVARSLRASKPDLRILCLTGHPVSKIPHGDFDAVVQKPVPHRELLKAIRRLVPD